MVLSHALWREHYAGDLSVLGRDVTLNGVRRMVFGIMPAGFQFPAGVAGRTLQVLRLSAGNSLMFPVIGRLKPGVTSGQARAQFDSIRRDLPQQPPAKRLPGRSGSFRSKSCWWAPAPPAVDLRGRCDLRSARGMRQRGASVARAGVASAP